MTREPLLRLRDVRQVYNDRTVLDVAELSIDPGTITGLSGPNGSGKSTLLKILSLSERCTSGTVYFQGRAVLPFDAEAHQQITMLPQVPHLLTRNVFNNIAYGLKIRGRKTGLRDNVAAAMDLVGLDSSFAARQWHQLSGGEAQRVALAARLVLKPLCLLLDEPTASVDMESARAIRRAILLARKEWGTTLVITSHNQSWLNDLCDSVIYQYNGRILDCSLENILLGPWLKNDRQEFCKKLADGQFILVPSPPGPDSIAVIAPEVLKLTNALPDHAAHTLTGTVIGIYLDRHSSEPRIHVVCGDHRLVANVPDLNFNGKALLPGQTVTLHYLLENITWLMK
jgi:tungstate transport system ATP-binding protein